MLDICIENDEYIIMDTMSFTKENLYGPDNLY